MLVGMTDKNSILTGCNRRELELAFVRAFGAVRGPLVLELLREEMREAAVNAAREVGTQPIVP